MGKITGGNYIKLFRKVSEWGWYKDNNTKALFLHLLIKANWKDAEFMGHKVPRGSLATSLQHLADDTGLSKQNVRTALEHLKSTGEISEKLTPKFRIIKVEKYTLFQGVETEANTQLTPNQHPTNTNRRNKEGKKEINNKDICISKEKEHSKGSLHQTNVNNEQFWNDLLKNESKTQ